MLAQTSATPAFPRVAAYLDSLDHGIASFPELRAKGSMIRTELRVLPVEPAAVVGAPPRLRELVESPPLDSAWISEVEYCAFSLLVADVHGLDVAGFGRFWYDVMTELVTSKIYAPILRWIAAPMMLRSTATRWGSFHRGCVVTTSGTESGMQVDASYPPGLMPEICVHGYTQVWQSLIDHSRTRNATARLVDVGEGWARWHCDGFR